MHGLAGNPFAELSVVVNIILFAFAAIVVWVAGTRLAVYADTIADRKRIGKIRSRARVVRRHQALLENLHESPYLGGVCTCEIVESALQVPRAIVWVVVSRGAHKASLRRDWAEPNIAEPVPELPRCDVAEGRTELSNPSTCRWPYQAV